jgi:hypothetical protein
MLALTTSVKARGDTFTWAAASGTGDWFAAANWTNQVGANGVPGTGDTVRIHAGADILLSNETATLRSFEMDGGTLIFTNWSTRLQTKRLRKNK